LIKQQQPKQRLLKQRQPEKRLLRQRQPELRLLKQPRKMFQAVAVFWLLLDAVTKQFVLHTMELRESVPVWEGIFHLTYVRNYGAAFSMLQGQLLVFYIALALMLAIVAWFWLSERPNHWMPVVATALVVAGAFGNTLDRVFYGSVVDMFDFRAINFAIFNVADIGITVGSVLFFIWLCFLSGHIQWSTLFTRSKEGQATETVTAGSTATAGATATIADSEAMSHISLLERLELRLQKWEADIDSDLNIDAKQSSEPR
jgi:signal peptidase II